MENLTFDEDAANPAFVQKRLIDYGAFAEIHEVNPNDRYGVANG